jgi:hypothetical protein
MTTPPATANSAPDLLAAQNTAIETLTATVELLQRRVDSIAGVPLPQEPPEPGQP